MDSELIYRESESIGYLSDSEEKQCTIFVVNDSKIELMSLEHILKKKYQVILTDSVEDAKDQLIIDSFTPDLIMIDLKLHDMSGYAFSAWTKSLSRLSNVPVIFVSENFTPEEEIASIRVGAMDYIYMPFREDIIYRKIDRTILLSKLTRSLDGEVKKQTALAHTQLQRTKRITKQLMNALAETVDAKDHYTNGHSKRVAKYSVQIARRAGKTPQECEEVYYAGILHDVGKIGIPGEVLRKTSKLTDDEYTLIKNHTTIGAKILSGITELPIVAEAAHYHHERMDGSGYPKGLKGDEIPEIARIVAVADAYDAMTSKRSYRSILPQHVVRSEIVAASGTQLDKQFADIMLQMIDDDKDYQMHEAI